VRAPRPITPTEARGTLAQRLSPIADRIRQRVAVRLGVRAYRVFLVWTKSGLSPESERGDGNERIIARVEILPAPRVLDLTGLLRRSFSTGTVSEGSIRVDRISSHAYSDDELRGNRVPAAFGAHQPLDPRWAQQGPGGEVQFAQPVDFFYEVVEDGRGDDPAYRRRFSLMADPMRDPGGAQWIVALRRADRDLKRDGLPQAGGFPVIP
jgi:hypothetical protein